MKIELTSYLGLDYTSQDQYSLDLGLKMANREEATREGASSVGTADNVVSEVVNQPAAYPVTQTQYYTGSYVGPTGSVVSGSGGGVQVGEVPGGWGGGGGGTVVPPVPTPVPTPVQPVVPPVTPVVSTQQTVPCCPTSWMGTHPTQSSESGEVGVMRSSSRVSEFTGERVTVCGETGVLVNVSEIKSFTGPVPLTDYPINQDTSPEVVRKQADPAFIEYTQDVCLTL